MSSHDPEARRDGNRTRSRRSFVGALGTAGLVLTAVTTSTALEDDGGDGAADGGDPIGRTASVADTVDHGPTEIDSCTVIDQPGEYELVADLAPATLSQPGCIVIDSDGVTLRGNGHTIDVSDVDRHGVVVHPDRDREVDWDTVVEDLEVRGGDAGISAQLSGGGEYRDITAVDNNYGFEFFVEFGTLENCVAADNATAGVFIHGDDVVWGGGDMALRDCTLQSNARGLWIGHESTVTATSCRIVENDEGVRTSPVGAVGRIEDSHICSNVEVGVLAVTDEGYDEEDESQPPREGRVTAVGNYWGAANGPSSYGDPDDPYEDPDTGRPADGDGDAVSESLDPGVSNVRFDPFLQGPVDGVGADR